MANHAMYHKWEGNKKYPPGEYKTTDLCKIRGITKQTFYDRVNRHNVEWAMDKPSPGSLPMAVCLCGCETKLNNPGAKFVNQKHRRRHYKRLMLAGELEPSGHNTCHCGKKFPWYTKVSGTKERKTCSVFCCKKITGTNGVQKKEMEAPVVILKPIYPSARGKHCNKKDFETGRKHECAMYSECWGSSGGIVDCAGFKMPHVVDGGGIGNQGVAVSRGLAGFGGIKF